MTTLKQKLKSGITQNNILVDGPISLTGFFRSQNIILRSSKRSSHGLINDSIGDMLTRIRNACLAKKSTVSIPFTKINILIAQILEQEGFIQTYQVSLDSQDLTLRLKYRSKKIYRGKKKESCITNLKRISKPGLRIYSNHKEILRILGGTGIVILSTPEGLMTDREARLRGIGGELLCSVW
uniref:Ribosomal protein S8 n=1 Tax=Volvulina compacta TaxID=51721 RepID=A0A6C0RVD4_9CHLO|nr:ribosomal protein S8 [Volvulina compacta]